MSFPAFAAKRGARSTARGGARPGRRQDRAAGEAEIDRTAEFPWDVYEELVRADLQAVQAAAGRRDRDGDRHRGGRPGLRLVVADPGGGNKLGTVPGCCSPRARTSRPGTSVPVALGEAMFSYALSEPEAGSDAGHEDQGGAYRLRLRAERGEAMDHQRRGVEVLHGDGGHRSLGGPRQGFRRSCSRTAIRASPSGRPSTSWHQRLADPGAVLRRLRDPGVPADRRRRRGHALAYPCASAGAGARPGEADGDAGTASS